MNTMEYSGHLSVEKMYWINTNMLVESNTAFSQVTEEKVNMQVSHMPFKR